MARKFQPRSHRPLLPHAHVARTANVVSLDAQAQALRELRRSLSGSPREVPCKYLYDDAGSALFEQIMHLPEYFPTRTERALLSGRAQSIVEAAGGSELSDVVELGSGAASKTVALLDAALALGGQPRYVAVDISQHALNRTRQILAEARPEIEVKDLLADYTKPLQLPPKEGRRLVLFLGGTIGNDDDAAAISLLTRVRSHMDPGDSLLLGCNLVTDPAEIHAAYNDSQGVTASFNKNILLAVNRVAQSKFDDEKFHHYAPYVVEQRRVEMWLIARERLEIDLGRIGGTLKLEQGEGIRTEISRRFDRDGVLRLLDAAGFSPERWMASPCNRYGLVLGVARKGLHDL